MHFAQQAASAAEPVGTTDITGALGPGSEGLGRSLRQLETSKPLKLALCEVEITGSLGPKVGGHGPAGSYGPE